MDSADSDPVRATLRAATAELSQEMGEMMEHQENQLSFGSQTDFLDDQIQKLHSPLVVFSTASLHFSADVSDCIAFLYLVSYILNFKIPHSPLTLYSTTYIISYPSSWTETWATAESSRRSTVYNFLLLFIKTFTQIFQKVSPEKQPDPSLFYDKVMDEFLTMP